MATRGNVLALIRKSAKNVYRLAEEVIKERGRQLEKWGPQTHPSGTGPEAVMAGRTMAYYAKLLKNWNDQQATDPRGVPCWAPILLEEIFEALESNDLAHVREELVQSMAVIAAWIEDIDAKGHL